VETRLAAAGESRPRARTHVAGEAATNRSRRRDPGRSREAALRRWTRTARIRRGAWRRDRWLTSVGRRGARPIEAQRSHDAPGGTGVRAHEKIGTRSLHGRRARSPGSGSKPLLAGRAGPGRGRGRGREKQNGPARCRTGPSIQAACRAVALRRASGPRAAGRSVGPDRRSPAPASRSVRRPPSCRPRPTRRPGSPRQHPAYARRRVAPARS